MQKRKICAIIRLMPKKYFAVLLIIALIFFGLIGLAINSLTKNKPANNQTQQASQQQKDLTKDTRSVTFTEQGKVVADENYRAIRITVSPAERKIEILQGYDQAVIKSQTFSNKQSSYDTFMIALKNAGFDNYDKNANSDERGVCPTGKRYTYEAKFSDGSEYKSWSASCQGSGSFKGNNGLVRSLFQDQIPNYDTFVSGTKLT